MLNMAQVSKNNLDEWSISVQNTLPPGSYSFRKVVFQEWPFITSLSNLSEDCEQEPINIIGSAAQNSLEKQISEENVFCCEGKIILFSFPKNPVLHEQ